MPPPRRLASQLLERWDHSQRHAQDLLADAFAKHSRLAPKDRALTQNLLFGVLRNRRMLDHWIKHLRSGPLDDDARRLLQLGLYQLYHTRIPDHAAVSETLRLAPARFKGLANAILRRAGRERETLERLEKEAPPAIRHSLPDFLYEKWSAQFGADDAAALAAWCQQPSPNYLRRNDLLESSATLIRDQQLPPAAVPDRDDFFQVDDIPHALLEVGAGYIQDPATVLACDLLGVKSGHRVLDACAAPGGKTAYLVQCMGNEGTLIATDSSRGRRRRLETNLQRLGVKRIDVREANWTQPNNDLDLFDRILLDVPCSNTGVLRRRVDLRWRLQPETFTEMATLQEKLAQNALKQLRPGGRLVYSTCSIEREENEAVIARLLESDPKLRLKEQQSSLPQRDGFDGAFAALLVKKAS